ncbi:hypothetical protein C8R47DRAFT_1329589 [Mycena vitilis]|nr:hypothetical protein C8R47DRAFT_1329589 [Mycena vitilis]
MTMTKLCVGRVRSGAKARQVGIPLDLSSAFTQAFHVTKLGLLKVHSLSYPPNLTPLGLNARGSPSSTAVCIVPLRSSLTLPSLRLSASQVALLAAHSHALRSSKYRRTSPLDISGTRRASRQALRDLCEPSSCTPSSRKTTAQPPHIRAFVSLRAFFPVAYPASCGSTGMRLYWCTPPSPGLLPRVLPAMRVSTRADVAPCLPIEQIVWILLDMYCGIVGIGVLHFISPPRSPPFSLDYPTHVYDQDSESRLDHDVRDPALLSSPPVDLVRRRHKFTAAATTARDPCTLCGKRWRLPSKLAERTMVEIKLSPTPAYAPRSRTSSPTAVNRAPNRFGWSAISEWWGWGAASVPLASDQ